MGMISGMGFIVDLLRSIERQLSGRPQEARSAGVGGGQMKLLGNRHLIHDWGTMVKS